MELLHWEHRPSLRQPALVAAFEGWNDAGNAASGAAAYLMRAWNGKRFATFDSEELFDFTSTRPQVRLESGETRRLEWPSVVLSSASAPVTDRDVVFLAGPEPQLRWRSFSEEVRETCAALGVNLAVFLGALLADVPHTRPVRVSGGAGNPQLAALAGVEPSYYEGPTGIVGVVADALGRAGIATTSLWASVPHYVSQSSSPKATLALVERCARVLGAEVDVAKLQISAAAYERQINELVASDEDASAYVTRLEEQDAEVQAAEADLAPDDENSHLTPASGDRLAAEVERYLREHRKD
jgi:proteasome assembly chaperone (PAC2) family protein